MEYILPALVCVYAAFSYWINFWVVWFAKAPKRRRELARMLDKNLR